MSPATVTDRQPLCSRTWLLAISIKTIVPDMDATRIDAILDLLSDEELREIPRWVDVFERWNMPADEAEDWRRRIMARRGPSRNADPNAQGFAFDV